MISFPNHERRRSCPIKRGKREQEANRHAVDPYCELRAEYAKLIRLRGITSSQTEIKARELGIDVDALVAEREREINAWKVIDVRLDLATLTLDPQGRSGGESFRTLGIQNGSSHCHRICMAAYIDLNPVRAGMVKDPADYWWSSYGEALGGVVKGVLWSMRDLQTGI